MGHLHVIDAAAVRKLLTYDDAVPAMEDTMVRASRRELYEHPRVTVEPPGHGGMVLLMPAVGGPAEEPVLGLKMLSMFPRAIERELPSVQGLVILVDAIHGQPLALVDAGALTEIRTAAVTAVATRALARADARTLAVVGAGVQARGHLEALSRTRDWERVRIFSRTRSTAEELARWAKGFYPHVEVSDSTAEALADCDVLCTATSVSGDEPVFAASELPAGRGVHVNAIGAFGPGCRELPTETVASARLIVDNREAALREAGDILLPIAEGALTEDAIAAEIGEVLAGTRPGRTDDTQTTVFETLGLPVQDAVAAALVYRKAVEHGIGERISFP
ncbi:ornithine cyclodeaminase family protein [Streptomyces sp. NPDC093071]|uniref:ornithine cyclodeaminase family protein n=1 Tax=Streptomyces sp. NPDC093071 TaxID=3366022 RepID=UPI00380E8F2B